MDALHLFENVLMWLQFWSIGVVFPFLYDGVMALLAFRLHRNTRFAGSRLLVWGFGIYFGLSASVLVIRGILLSRIPIAARSTFPNWTYWTFSMSPISQIGTIVILAGFFRLCAEAGKRWKHARVSAGDAGRAQTD